MRSQAKPPDEQVDFDWTASQVMLRSGSKTTTHALTPGSQDMASLWLEIIWRDQGWQELAGELMPGTIGAELQEMEETV